MPRHANSAHSDVVSRPLSVRITDNRIILRGDLDDSRDAYLTIAKELGKLAKAPHKELEIVAEDSCLLRGGLSTWNGLVADCLAQHKLRYAPSQLGMALYYYQAYTHRDSTFAEEDMH
jgi:hypothetical protein